jgi:UDP-arabinose 4-epimerase
MSGYMRLFFLGIFLLNSLWAWAEGSPKAIPQAILVTGGAGYIGTQTCKALKEAGFLPIAYDNFSKGSPVGFKWGVLVEGDVSDRKKLSEVIDRYHPIAVIHMAAFKAVAESIRDPAKYYLNNLSASLILLDVMREKGVKKLIFSSSALVYQDAEGLTPLKETMPCHPRTPYGASKWMVERMIEDFRSAYGFHYVVLRYFNVAGADLSGECGERGEVPHNLIPIVLQIASRKTGALEIFGSDYATRDGTAVRDYLHVADLADAHLKALDYLLKGKPSIALNLGTGQGSSVREVLEMARLVTGKSIPEKQVPRRTGDPSFLTADPALARELLGWEATHSDLKTLLESEWKWTQSLNSKSEIK